MRSIRTFIDCSINPITLFISMNRTKLFQSLEILPILIEHGTVYLEKSAVTNGNKTERTSGDQITSQIKIKEPKPEK